MAILIRSLLVLSFATITFTFGASAEAKSKDKNFPPHIEREIEKQKEQAANGSDAALVDAVNNQRRVDFVEGAGLVVVRLLPDDTSGLEHQKWVVRLSNGKLLQAVYNSDMCPRVPLKEGDVISMGGQFIWTKSGGLLHWLHHDPKGNRRDGYVGVGGKMYCDR